MENLEEKVGTDEESHLVPQSGHHLFHRDQLSRAFRAQENTEDAQRLQSRLLCHTAPIAFVDQYAPDPELQSQGDRFCFSAAQTLLEGLDPNAIADGPDRDPALSDGLMDRVGSGVLADGLELLNNSLGDEDFVESLAQKMELVDRGEIEEW
jgi:hypothetical protein